MRRRLFVMLNHRALHTARTRLTDLLAAHKHKIIGGVGAIALITAHRADHGHVHREQHAGTGAPAESQESEDFFRMARFGMVDMSILLMSLVAGVSLDGVIARLVGVQGYGAIVGAGLGNVTADVIAGLPDGMYSSLGVGFGTLLPLMPLAIPMALKMPFTRVVSTAFGVSSLGFCVFAFVWGFRHRSEQHAHEKELEEGASRTAVVVSVEELVNAGRVDDAIAALQQYKAEQAEAINTRKD